MSHVFKHPKYYKELRTRNKDQAISHGASTEANSRRAPDPDASDKQQATSVKRQAVPDAGDKRQASSTKGQAPSHKRQAP